MVGEMSDRVKLPNGTELYDPEDFAFTRDRIYEKAKSHVESAFPMSYNGVRMEVSDVDYADPPDYDLARQKEALLKDEFLSRRLRGTVRLVDEKTGQPLDQKSMTLMRVPHLTERGTFLHLGSEYSHSRQARLLPGAYSRRQSSGELESQLNTKSGTGPAFRIGFEPNTAQYRVKIRGSNLHMYSLLRDLGVTDAELTRRWGPEVLAANASKYDPRVISKAYQHLVAKKEQKADAPMEQKAAMIRAALDSAMLHREAVTRTLPAMLGEKQASAWRDGINAKAREFDRMAFDPDLCAADLIGHVVKMAAEFEPDLDADEMREPYHAIYAKVGPQLASMRKWPTEWFQPGDNEMGWIDWYIKYRDGQRGDEDERQIRRWKSFKARHGAAFKAHPTPRRAFALRNWAIDPLKLIEDPEKRKDFEAEMTAYREAAEERHAEKNAALPMMPPLPVIEHLAPPPRVEQSWVAGLRASLAS